MNADRPSNVFGRGIWNLLTHPLVVSVGGSVAVWALLSEGAFPFLPTPIEVGRAFAELVVSEQLYVNMAITLRRVLISWVGAYLLALVLGVWMGRSWLGEVLGHPWVFIGLALPGPVVVLLAILAMGLGELTTIVALWVMVTPYIVTFIYGSVKALDPLLDEMAAVYRMSRSQKMRHVVLPQLAPTLMTAARYGFASTWKIVILVEVLSATSGVGERIQYYFVFNRPDIVIAWTLSFALIEIFVEIFFFRKIDKKLFAWRPKEAESIHAGT